MMSHKAFMRQLVTATLPQLVDWEDEYTERLQGVLPTGTRVELNGRINKIRDREREILAMRDGFAGDANLDRS